MKLLKKVDPLLIVWYFGLFGSFLALVATTVMGNFSMPPTYLDRLGVILVGFFSLFAQISLTFASRHVPLPVVSLIRSSELAFLFFVQITLFNVVPTYLSMIGSVIVLISVALLISRAFIIDGIKRHEGDTEDDSSCFSRGNKYYTFLLCLTK